MSDNTNFPPEMANFIGGEGLITKEEGAARPADPQDPPQAQEQANDTGNEEESDQTGAEIDDRDGDAADSGDDAADDDGNADGDGEENDDLEGRKKRRSGAERFRRQRERAEAAEQRAAALEARLAAIEASLKPQPQQELTPDPKNETTAASQAPDPANYPYGDLDPNYISDLAEFKAEQKVAQLRQEFQATQQQDVAKREAEKVAQEIAETTRIGSERYSDFEEVVVKGAEAGEWALTKDVYDAVMASDNRVDLFYHLATNPDESDRVANMDARSLYRWIGHMEATVKAPEPRKVSKAPVPVNSARGSGGKFAPSAATEDFAAFERLAMQGK